MTHIKPINLKLSSEEKEKIGEILECIDSLKWESGEYLFHNFVDYFQMPQIVRVKQTWNNGLTENQCLFLHCLFDRYLIIGNPLVSTGTTSNEKYLIPDWFQGECRILSKNPKLKQRWWVFQGAFELYRFQYPRTIKVLSHTPAHRNVKQHE